MKRRLPLAVRGALVLAGLLALVLGVAVALTDPDPSSLLTRERIGTLIGLGASPGSSPAQGPPPEPVPLFSDDWFDDSGYSFIVPFAGPLDDPTSLKQMAASIQGRGQRGIAFFNSKLQELNPDDPRTPALSARLHWLIGGLSMFEGDFAVATEHFEKARDADPSSPDDYRANMEALLGIAALRRGEVENCVACCNEASCIFPLAPEAVHLQPSGSREAIRRFTTYLEARPEDLGVRWLLNVAAMTLGAYPDGVPEPWRLPLGPSRSLAEFGRFTNVASRVGLSARGENMAGGSAFDDFDGDGLPDIFLSTSDPSQGCALFLNRGDGTFEDRSESAGLLDQVGALNCTHADYDNDGRLDVLLLRGGWEGPRRMSLLRNRGDGTFVDVTIPAGLARPIGSQAAAWADYDNDGRLDLYVAGEYDAVHPDMNNRGRLYHNRGDGTFEDVASFAGVENFAYGKGAAWGDYDDDGDADLYVANLGQPNRLYRNDGGSFTNVALELGVAEPTHAFACWFWDYDNDGRLDLYVNAYGAMLADVVRSHLGRPTGGERPRLYRNEGGTFRDVTRDVGLDRVVMPMGCNFGDIDNDGYLDIYLGTGKPSYSFLTPNVLLRNDAGQSFEDVTDATGTGHLQKGHGVSFADWDRDGDLDLLVEAGGATPGDRAHNILFQNPGRAGNHWVRLSLTGTTTNRAAFGASILLTLRMPDGSRQLRHRVVGNNSSFGGNSLVQHVGLGPAEAVESLEVVWPTSGPRQVFRNIPLDAALAITEGEDDFEALDWAPIALP